MVGYERFDGGSPAIEFIMGVSSSTKSLSSKYFANIGDHLGSCDEDIARRLVHNQI